MTKQRKTNTLADNCKMRMPPVNFVGYTLMDGSFVVVAGGTAYTAQHCTTLRDALQRNYTHTLEVVSGERYAEIKKTYDTRKGVAK